MLYRVFALIGPMITPARRRTEHWPLEKQTKVGSTNPH